MISHHHRCIFIHVPKAAGESVERAFTDDLGMTGSRVRQLLISPNSLPENGPPYLSHLVASDYTKLQYVPQTMFDEYFTFSVIRNPWARVVSMYRYLNIHVPFSYFVQELLPNRYSERLHYFVRPQTDFVCDDGGAVIVDRIIRFENLESEFYEVCDRLGLPRSLPHVNASSEGDNYRYLRVRARQVQRGLLSRNLKVAYYALHEKDHFEHYTDYYEDESRRAVAEFYGSDVETFDYSFE